MKQQDNKSFCSVQKAITTFYAHCVVCRPCECYVVSPYFLIVYNEDKNTDENTICRWIGLFIVIKSQMLRLLIVLHQKIVPQMQRTWHSHVKIDKDQTMPTLVPTGKQHGKDICHLMSCLACFIHIKMLTASCGRWKHSRFQISEQWCQWKKTQGHFIFKRP